MVRSLREESPTGYYHVMTRGINRKIIFHDDKDRIKYLCCISDALEKKRIRIICYCLMPNHTHLLVYDDKNYLSSFMHNLDGKYAAYYNTKYSRIGSLFQDRFRSECVIDERQLLATYRYILNNPYKAGMGYPWEYKWSSYSCFLNPSNIANPKIIVQLLGSEEIHKDFIASYADDNFIDVEQ